MKPLRGTTLFWVMAAFVLVLWRPPIEGASASSQSGLEDCAAFGPGLIRYKMGKYFEAGEVWEKLAAGLPFEKGPHRGFMTAGMAKVLASIAFERAGDPKMFECWDSAQVAFREAGTAWEVERRKFLEEVSDVRAAVRTMKPGAGQAVSQSGELVCLELEKELSLSTYGGPSKELQGRSGEPGPTITSGRHYFARPFQPGTGGEGTVPGDKSQGSGSGVGASSDGGARVDGGLQPYESAKARRPLAGGDAGKPGESAVDGGPAGSPMSRSVPFSAMGQGSVERAPVGDAGSGGTGTDASKVRMPQAQTIQEGRMPSGSNAGDMEIARIAWKYFVRNYHEESGMVSPVAGYVYGTFWDVASVLAAYAAAEKLGLISRSEFQDRTGRLLQSLLSMPLYKDELPNREYDLRRLVMVDLGSRASRIGSGWSAIDLGRLLIWLRIVYGWYPEFQPTIQKAVDRWKFDRSCSGKQLNCALFDGRRELILQEGRLGYEQYAASGYGLWGRDVDDAFDTSSVRWVDLHGEKIPVDTRTTPFLTSEPFFLSRIELGGLGKKFNDIVDSVYRVQKRRAEVTGTAAAVTEDTVDRVPWFVYYCIYYEGTAWACVNHRGQPCPALKSFSTKAALAWSAIYDDSYAKELRRLVVSSLQSDAGFYAGRYETGKNAVNRSLNVNTNGVILEAMLYLRRGREPFLRFKPPGQ